MITNSLQYLFLCGLIIGSFLGVFPLPPHLRGGQLEWDRPPEDLQVEVLQELHIESLLPVPGEILNADSNIGPNPQAVEVVHEGQLQRFAQKFPARSSVAFVFEKPQHRRNALQ